MNTEDLSLVPQLIFAAVSLVGVWAIRTYFKRKDAEHFKEQTSTQSVLTITSYAFRKNNFVYALQNAVVMSVYLCLIMTILGIGSVVFGLVSYDGVWLLVWDLVASVVRLFPTFVIIFTAVLYIVQIRERRPIPNFLVSRKYSLTAHIFVDDTGFDGAFALPWQKIYRCEQVEASVLKFSYRRSPYLLTRLIGADTICLDFHTGDVCQQVLDIYNRVKK